MYVILMAIIFKPQITYLNENKPMSNMYIRYIGAKA